MVRKRSYPRGRNDDLPVFAPGLTELNKKQEEGEAAYGDAVLSKDQRLGQSHVFFVGINSPQPRSKQVTYIPPAKVVPSASEISDVLNEMTHDVVIPEEEIRLVEEARRLGWSWQKIANELQGRTPKQLMRACSEPRPTNRYIYEPLRSTRPRLIPPPLDSSSRFQPPLKRPPPPPPSRPSNKRQVSLSQRQSDRMADDSRVSLSRQLETPPSNFTGLSVHQVLDLEKIKFFERANVIDVDDSSRVFTFDLKDSVHCACFNIGEGKDGSPLLSWSDLFAFYQLPDGTQWAEHGYLYDKEDMELFAKKTGRDFQHLIPADMSGQELIKKKGRFHSRLSKIEHECWIYKDKIPEDHSHEDDDYFYRIVFDPMTMMRLDAKTL